MNMEAMHALLLSLPRVATIGLVFAFGASGLVQLVGPSFVRRAYQRWALPPRFHRVIGALMLLAAFFLTVPNTRLWGVMLAGLINFLAVVTLLKNREYGWALPGLAVAIALPVMLVTTLQHT
ncbi:MAG: DoxX family protein [Burkholderiales bacterium]